MEMINLQLQIFLLLALGWILGKIGMINKSSLSALTELVMNVVLPAAIIRSFEIDLTPEILRSTFTVLVLSILIQLFCIFLNRFLWSRCKNPTKRTNLKYGTVVNNAGTMGMVIAEAAFGETGLLYASIFMIPVRIMMWSYGITLYSGQSGKRDFSGLRKVLLHPCIIAVYIGVILMLLRMGGIVLPAFLAKTINSVANCNTALCMICIGIILSEVEPRDLADSWAFIYSAIRLVALPALIFVILKMTGLPSLAVNVCIIETAMPAPSTMAMLAQKYGENPAFASKMIFISTLLSLITLPIWTYLFTLPLFQ